MSRIVQVSTTTDSQDSAAALAQSAVQGRLAAGAQIIGPITTMFWHANEFGTGEEWQVVLKTSAERYPDLEAHLLAQHPWRNPDISMVRIEAGTRAYIDWVDRTVGTAGSP